MKTFTIQRIGMDREAAVGRLSSDDMGALCFTLDAKVIPEGTYGLEIKPLGTSKFDTRMISFFSDIHIGMIRLKDVPGHSEILIHIGNSAKDTEGCVLVGNSFRGYPPAGFGVPNSFWLFKSAEAYRVVYPLIVKAIKGDGAQLAVGDPVSPAIS